MEPRSRRAPSRRQSLERADAVRACSLTYQCGTCQVHRPTCAAACARRVVRVVCARRVRASCARGACAHSACVHGVSRCGRLVIIAMRMSLVSSLTVCATNVAVRRDRFVWRFYACVQRADACFSAGPRRAALAFQMECEAARSLRAVSRAVAVTQRCDVLRQSEQTRGHLEDDPRAVDRGTAHLHRRPRPDAARPAPALPGRDTMLLVSARDTLRWEAS